MAQKQYNTYQSDILSFELRDALLGMLKPGRYIGFNAMSEYQAQSGDDVYLAFAHTTGIPKYNKADPPVLESTRGVVVTTQGAIIAEDAAIQLTLTLGGYAGGCKHIVYMEHHYIDGVPGANNATYGIKHGGDPELPTLDYPTKQVIIGIIEEASYADSFADLTWFPYHPGMGDDDLHSKLFRATAYKTWVEGSQPNDGIIGNRAFTSNNYITDYQSLTDVISDLDSALKTEETARIAVGNRAIDSMLWGALTDIAWGNVNTARHGLCPIAPNDTTKFLRGDATWALTPGKRFVMRTGTFGDDYTINDPTDYDHLIDMTGVGGCPSDADALIIRFNLHTTASFPDGQHQGIWFRSGTSGGYHYTGEVNNETGTPTDLYLYDQCIVPCDANQHFYLHLTSYTYVDHIDITLVGWQTSIPV